MITKTSLQSLPVSIKLYKAIREAAKLSLQSGTGRAVTAVVNRNNEPFITVVYQRNTRNAFRFFYKTKDITNTVKTVLAEVY